MLLVLKSLQERIEQDLQLAVFEAWHTARLTNHSGKTFPQLGKEIEKWASLKPKARRRQTPEEMIAAMQAIRSRSVH